MKRKNSAEPQKIGMLPSLVISILILVAIGQGIKKLVHYDSTPAIARPEVVIFYK